MILLLYYRISDESSLGILRCTIFLPNLITSTEAQAVCVFLVGKGEGGGGTPLRHGHKESYKYLNLKNSTSEWDSNPRPHEY